MKNWTLKAAMLVADVQAAEAAAEQIRRRFFGKANHGGGRLVFQFTVGADTAEAARTRFVELAADVIEAHAPGSRWDPAEPPQVVIEHQA